MKSIPLSSTNKCKYFGKYNALVDDEDYKWLSQWNWQYFILGYAGRQENKKMIFMHREIVNAPIGKRVDHINHNGLDNRRENLRVVTNSQNLMNMRKHRGISKFKGVSWNKKHKSWETYINKDGKRYRIGMFTVEHHAAMAYDMWAKDLFGKFARFNFPI